MVFLTQASQGTRRLWALQAPHAIRIELVIWTFSVLSLIFATAQIAIRQDAFLAVLEYPAPIVSLGLSTGAILAFTRRTLHPVYSLCVAVILFLGMVATIFWVVLVDIDEIVYFNEDQRYPPPGLVVIKDICYAILTAAYLVYIGFAASAVDAHRKRKRQGVLELEDAMAIPLRSKSDTV